MRTLSATILCITICIPNPTLSQKAYNCPLVFEDLISQAPSGTVVMSAAETEIYQQALAYADQRSKGNEVGRLLIIGEAIAEIGTGRAEGSKTLSTTPRSAEQALEGVQKRVDEKWARWEGTDARFSPVESGALKQMELRRAITVANLAKLGQYMTVYDGQLDWDFSIFKSTVAIVAPEFDQDISFEWELAKLPLCSGTRVSKSAVLTAAHCVCALKLHQNARQVRIGDQVRVNPGSVIEHVGQATTNPGKTRCFSGSCNDLCAAVDSGGSTQANALSGSDVALIFVDNFVSAHGASTDAAQWAKWQETSKIASETYYTSNVVSGGGRLFVLGFGYDPKTPLDHGLGVKRCGQLLPKAPCTLANLPCDPNSELLLRADVPHVNQNTDACPGDSGGPAFVMEKDAAGKMRFHVAGIVSRGPSHDGKIWDQCGADGTLYAFASKPSILQWIHDTVATEQQETVVER